MKIKKSFAIEPELYQALQRFTKEYGFSSEAVALNFLLSSTLLLPTELCDKVSKVCEFEYDRLDEMKSGQNDMYATNAIIYDKKKINDFKSLMNLYAEKGSFANSKSNKTSTESMRRSNLARGYGYAIYPRSWVVLNEPEIPHSKYAYVFEARNAEQYNVPIFIYFSGICYWDIPARDKECAKMDDLIKRYSEDCANAFKCQVKEIYETDETGRSVWINREEWANSFVPAHFMLPIKGSTLPYCDSASYPYDAYIVRPHGYDYEKDNRYMKRYD